MLYPLLVTLMILEKNWRSEQQSPVSLPTALYRIPSQKKKGSSRRRTHFFLLLFVVVVVVVGLLSRQATAAVSNKFTQPSLLASLTFALNIKELDSTQIDTSSKKDTNVSLSLVCLSNERSSVCRSGEWQDMCDRYHDDDDDHLLPFKVLPLPFPCPNLSFRNSVASPGPTRLLKSRTTLGGGTWIPYFTHTRHKFETREMESRCRRTQRDTQTRFSQPRMSKRDDPKEHSRPLPGTPLPVSLLPFHLVVVLPRPGVVALPLPCPARPRFQRQNAQKKKRQHLGSGLEPTSEGAK